MPTDEETVEVPTPSQLRVSMPIAVLAGIVGACAVGYAAWTARVDKDVAQDKHFEFIDTRVDALERDQRTTRELLIRIDENVNNIRRDQRRSNP